jgi:hypothetical protein
MQPLNQLLERAERESTANPPPTFTNALGELMSPTGGQAVMPFRIGYPTEAVPPSPRRPAEDVIRSQSRR